MSEMAETKKVRCRHADEREQRQRDKVAKRIEMIRRSVPRSFRLEIVENGIAMRLTEPYGFEIVWYPTLQKGRIRGQLRSMRAETVVLLIQRIDRERSNGGH